MELVLEIDNREHTVLKHLNELQVEFTIVQLPIGDMLIKDKLTEAPHALFERKTYADLVASLKDSRFREQKHRMENSTAPIKGYIIEGSYPIHALNGIKPSTIDSLLLGLSLRDNFTLIYSKNPAHTAELLGKMLVKCKEWLTSATVSTAHQDALIQGSLVKKDGLTVETCYLSQLAQIPGVSLVTARALKEKWPSMFRFLTFLNGESVDAIRVELAAFCVNGKRLGSSAAEKILDFLREPKAPKAPKKVLILKRLTQ
jgi:ERCC4-type nuclease